MSYKYPRKDLFFFDDSTMGYIGINVMNNYFVRDHMEKHIEAKCNERVFKNFDQAIQYAFINYEYIMVQQKLKNLLNE